MQGFIVTARKSSDLWFGSWLLSELARVAADAAINAGAELLVPNPDALKNKHAGVPARLVLRCPAGVSPETVIQAAQDAMSARLTDLFNRVLSHRDLRLDAVHQDAAHAQLQDLPELHWVAVLWEGGASFGAVMGLADRLLTAKKHHRPFKPPTWGNDQPKSSVDGARESVLDAEVMRTLREKPQELWKQLRVRPGEHLCGPGLLKRWAPRACTTDELGDGARTMSTSHIASWSLRRAWAKPDLPPEALPKLRSAWRDYLNKLTDLYPELDREGVHDNDRVLGDYDGGLLYKSRLTDVLNTKSTDTATIEAAERALKKLQDDWNKALAAHNQPPLSPVGGYYAVVVGDGDHLGKTLQALTDQEDVQDVSRRLLAFADKARAKAEEHHAQVVYIGGDDLLILAPVETVMECCFELQEAFKELVGAVATKRGLSPAPTLSVGVCVAHHLDPFQESVAAARKAEDHAKTTGGRDAFAVTVRPRSGPPTEIVGGWDRYAVLQQIQALFSDEKLPGGLAHDLRAAADAVPKDLLERRAPETPEAREACLKANSHLAELRVLEAKRVITQKRLDATTTEYLHELLKDADQRAAFAPRDLAEWMLVARRFAKNEEDRA